MSRVRVCALAAGIFLASLSAKAFGQDFSSPNLIDRMLMLASHEEPIPSTQLAPVVTAEDAMDIPSTQLAPVVTAEDAMESLRLQSVQEPLPAPASGVRPTFFQEPVSRGGAALEPLPAPVSGVRPTFSQEPVPAGDATADLGSTVIKDDVSYLWTDMGGACCSCSSCGLYGGLQGTFLVPLGEPVQTVTLTNLKKDLPYEGTAEPGLGAGLRAWAGIDRCGSGIRVQYWTFGSNYIHPHPIVPQKIPAFDEAYYLNANTFDIELTKNFCCGLWQVDASFGGRYARLERNSTVVGYGTAGGVDLYGLAMGGHQLEGAGFTFSIGTRKPVHFFPGMFWFCSYRGSLISAESSTSVLTEANAVSDKPTGAANSRDRAFACSDNDERLFMSELQLGVQYERCLPCCPAKLFFRAGMEYQHWNTGDLFAESKSYAFLQGGPPNVGGRVDAAANADFGDLDLIGFVLGAGLTY